MVMTPILLDVIDCKHFFQSPFQASEWGNADVLFADIDCTGCIHFKYLFNVVCLNSVMKKYMACGRALLNRTLLAKH